LFDNAPDALYNVIEPATGRGFNHEQLTPAEDEDFGHKASHKASHKSYPTLVKEHLHH
jgi:hypothetical protein